MTDRQLVELVARLGLRRWYANQRTGLVRAKRGGVWETVQICG